MVPAARETLNTRIRYGRARKVEIRPQGGGGPGGAGLRTGSNGLRPARWPASTPHRAGSMTPTGPVLVPSTVRLRCSVAVKNAASGGLVPVLGNYGLLFQSTVLAQFGAKKVAVVPVVLRPSPSGPFRNVL